MVICGTRIVSLKVAISHANVEGDEEEGEREGLEAC